MYSRILLIYKANVRKICNFVEIGLSCKEKKFVFYDGENFENLGAKLLV